MSAKKKVLAIFGATGNQGGSIISQVLSNPTLSSQYTIRALTRDPSSASASALRSKGITDIVAADLNNPSGLVDALRGAHTVFLNTASDPSLPWQEAKPSERGQGIAAADACVKAGTVRYLIFSTLPHVERMSKGKYVKVSGFDGKAEAEEYMRKLSAAPENKLQTAFFAPGSFMQNWLNVGSHSQKTTDEDGNEVLTVARPVSVDTKLPLIDIAADTGKFVGAILASPDEYSGKTLCAATRLYSMQEICDILAKHLSNGNGEGKMVKVKYQQVTGEMFKKFMRGSTYADILLDMMLYQQDFGYYGADTEELVRDAAERALGDIVQFEEFLEREMPVA
ncbi:NAD(P)-binding protein [Xylariaceae sp. FL0255]|nr:NAD(P)-binding protein [Xylariaceae sp. FL0255]